MPISNTAYRIGTNPNNIILSTPYSIITVMQQYIYVLPSTQWVLLLPAGSLHTIPGN